MRKDLIFIGTPFGDMRSPLLFVGYYLYNPITKDFYVEKDGVYKKVLNVWAEKDGVWKQAIVFVGHNSAWI